MIYYLENEDIKVAASTSGAELHSIYGKKTNTEYLWNGNPEYWKYHAPHLFPNIGKLVDSKYKVDGKEYELPAHGIARISEFEIFSKTKESITFELKYDENTLEIYPFKFSFQIQYTLKGNSVETNYKVINLDNKSIYFSVGAHPAFMCPIDSSETLEDCYLEFNKKETTSAMLINEEVYISYNRKEYLKDSNTLELNKALFESGLFIFDKLKSDSITIKSKKSDKFLTVEFNGFPYVGIWAPEKGAPFMCIEPWFGHPDYEDFNGEFKDREGTVEVRREEFFSCRYNVIVG
ncbi:aldose 1-epimerase family protein [Clostridium sp. C8-1-8]|uniref:aldose 1-epimerase family protein n=1 Tax=Clostridium sp. C8-1-8 TaxID=2698831 RepID=UPI0013685AD4|nr:aldose 1-epimerase family protein [Clostridium sp. C8-1-8]